MQKVYYFESYNAAITLSNEVLFAMLDIAGEYKTADEIGKQLATSAVTSTISILGAGAGAAVSGLSGIGGVLAKTGVSAATSVTSTVTVNVIQSGGDWDRFSDSMKSFDTWKGCISSTAGSLVTNSLGAINSYDSNGIALSGKVFDTSSIGKLNSLAGGLASTAVTYGLTGEATFNVLNIADFINPNSKLAGASSGLLEVTLGGEKGFSSRIGTGGTNISSSSLLGAVKGMNEASKVTDWKYGSDEQRSTLNAINMLGYTQVKTKENDNIQLAKDIWNGELGVEYGDTGEDYGNYKVGDDKIKLSNKLLCGGKEASAKLAAVMSHEGTHAYGNRVEGVAHYAADQTYSQINSIFKLNGDTSFSDQMLAGILDRDNWKENEDDVDHWQQVFENGQLGWREDGNYGFKFLDGVYLTPDEMKDYIEKTRSDFENGTYSKEALLFAANNSDPMKFNDLILEYQMFLMKSESFVDASSAAEILKQEISNGKSSNISQYTKKMGAALLNAQESGLLSKNPYGVIDTSNLIGEGNVIHPYFSLAGIVEGSSNPYINISSYEAWRINDVDMAGISTGSYILNEFSPFYHQGWDGNGNGNIVASLDGGLYLDYLNAEGFQVNNTTSLGTFGTSHASSSTVDQFFKLFGQEGVSLSHNGNLYELSGIKAGTVIGFVGNTGNNTTGAHAHMSLNGSGDQFAKVFNDSYFNNEFNYFRPTDYAMYLSGYEFPTMNNNPILWKNVQIYSNRNSNKLNFNDFKKHNSEEYMSNFWTRYPK